MEIPRLVEVVDITYLGLKETYDVEVEGPHHNFVANGIITHNSVNETSTRYSVAIDAAQRTAPDQWRLQAANNKQGSDGCADPDLGARLSQEEAELQDRARAVYNGRLDAGVAREQARKDLPLCTYTEAYWKVDLHNLLHFLALRMDPHAQLEIREYANVIGREIVARWVPLVWEAFEDYRLGASFFSRIEGEILAALGAGDRDRACAIAREAGWLKAAPRGGWTRHRERQECEAKLARLNLPLPW
ncbi:MAG: FAD-dependent thymidylate synthase [Candidatus Krumholzibacteriia bacterium]